VGGEGFGCGIVLDCASGSESSEMPQAYRSWEARADGDVSFLSRREATRRESPGRGGAAAPGQPKKFRN